MAAPAPKRRALGGGRGLAALVAGARAKRAEINLMDEEDVDDGGGGGGEAGGGRINAATATTMATTTTAAAATMEKPAPASQPSATPAAIRPALFYGGSLPRPPLHAGHQMATPGSAPVLANPLFRGGSGGGVPSAFAAGGMKTRWRSKNDGARATGGGGGAALDISNPWFFQSRCGDDDVSDTYRLSAGPGKAR